jgi:hypothetical protein
MKRILLIVVLMSVAFLSVAASKRLRIRGRPITPPPPQFPELQDVGGDDVADVGGEQIYAVH